MPRLPPRVTQSSKKSKIKTGCDEDTMRMKQFNKIVLDYDKCGDRVCGDQCCQVGLKSTARENRESEAVTLQPPIIDDKPVRLVNERRSNSCADGSSNDGEEGDANEAACTHVLVVSS